MNPHNLSILRLTMYHETKIIVGISTDDQNVILQIFDTNTRQWSYFSTMCATTKIHRRHPWYIFFDTKEGLFFLNSYIIGTPIQNPITYQLPNYGCRVHAYTSNGTSISHNNTTSFPIEASNNYIESKPLQTDGAIYWMNATRYCIPIKYTHIRINQNIQENGTLY